MPPPETPAPDGVTVQATVPLADLPRALLEAGFPAQAVAGASVHAAGMMAASEFTTDTALKIIALIREGDEKFAHTKESARAALDAARLWFERHDPWAP